MPKFFRFLIPALHIVDFAFFSLCLYVMHPMQFSCCALAPLVYIIAVEELSYWCILDISLCCFHYHEHIDDLYVVMLVDVIGASTRVWKYVT